ncbi:hypothetical protein [Alkalihalobacterium chitinilyticum]|uniref:Uncharacterized protein n=1 Tax=Alkalihalobacterium chitinilyticum TaxID=2980103 RepID=A0ABT5VD03_9BACI|nr:hypothetical protein [Alkalihalobacterium chitinilyticum]MDE5413222.1 hypothetical protein [Alkalihalobacterium chitinilyticum]
MIIYSDISVAWLLSLPLLVIYFKFSNLAEEHKRSSLAFPLWFTNFLLLQHLLNYGDLFWVVLLFQLIFLYPISIAVFLYISRLNQDETAINTLIKGLKRKQIIVVSVVSLLSVIGIGWGVSDSNQKVAQLHHQAMNEIVESEDPLSYLIYHSISPETLIGILPSLEDMNDGEVTVTSLPWKSTVRVSYENDTEAGVRTFTYVRFNEGWKLDGMYREEIR